MALKLKIKKGDKVKVITGSDKGKTGIVLEVNPSKMMVKVEGVRLMTHYDRQNGLVKKEGYIHYSNVQKAN
jgi:large subunit ribosomal protein L24